MKLNRFLRKHIFRNNAPEPAPAGDAAPSLDEGSGGGSDAISAIAGLIGGNNDEPAAAPDADPEPQADADPAPEPDAEPAPAADDELAQLRARVAELEGNQPKPDAEPAKPAATTILKSASEAITTEQLAAHEDYCERMREWTLQNWDGATIEGADGPVEMSAADVRKQFARFDNELRKAIPAQAATIEQRAVAAEQRKAVEADALKAYPWIAQPDSEDGKLYAKFSKALPAIAELPAGPMAIADMIAGFRARTRKAARPVSPVARTTPRPAAVPKPAAGGGAAPAALDAAKALDLLRSNGGDRRSVADVLLRGGFV